MTTERNELMKTTFPKLQQYFRGKGYEFQVVDLRWGIREEAVYDHQATTLCLEEIRMARQISKGVCFIALIGDKYGSCPLPATLSVSEYQLIAEQLMKVKESCQILEDWYKRDDNSIPPVYILLPVTDRYTYSNSSTPEHTELKEEQQNLWQRDQMEIRRLLQKAAVLVHAKGNFSDTEKHKFFMAVTEREISEGILNNANAEEDTLCFQRTFEKFNERDKNAYRYADLDESNHIIPQQKHFLQNLKQKKLKEALPSATNLFEYQVEWHPDGINPTTESSHRRYLDHFCSNVYSATIALTERKLSQYLFGQTSKLHLEIAHHLRFCNMKLETYIKRRKMEVHCQRALARTFEVMRPRYGHSGGKSTEVQTVTGRRPIIIHGPSGFGKTSLMAKIFQMFCSSHSTWQEADCAVKIIRFLGTSPLSCTIRNVLTSVISQLLEVFTIDDDETTLVQSSFEKGIVQLAEQFYNFLWSLERFPGKVLICLDSIDQLSTDDGAYSMHWLPLTLPHNIFLFVSMLTDASPNCLENSRTVLRDDKCYLETHFLGMDTAENILESYGKQAGRTLTGVQRNLILSEFRKSGKEAMFLKLAFELAKEWRSFTPINRISLGKNCKELIYQLFDRLEQQHGKWLIWTLEYLTASREGLSDNEIEDVLSLDDEVLQDVYIHHLPPESHIIRLPPMLWRRARRQLDEYLVTKEAGGVTVVNWYHRQFLEAAQTRLLVYYNKHAKLADYFCGKWSDKPKGLSLYKGKKADFPDALRMVPAMPYQYSDERSNLRKLMEFPFHIIRSYDVALAADLLCDLQFLTNRLRYSDFQNLMSDFSEYFKLFAPERQRSSDLVYLQVDTLKLETELGDATLAVKIVYDLLIMSGDSLKQDWTHLAVNIAGRLNNDRWRKYERIDRLVRDCLEWMQTTTVPLLYPTNHCLPPPGGLLKTSTTHTVFIPGRYRGWTDLLHIPSNQPSLLYVPEQHWNYRDTISVYDLTNADLIRKINPKCATVEWCQVVYDNRLLLLRIKPTRHAAEKTSALLACDTGEFLPLLPTGETFVQHLQFMQQKRQIVVAFDNSKLWRLAFGGQSAMTLVPCTEKPASLESDYGRILGIKCSPDDQFLVTAMSDAMFIVFQLDDLVELHRIGYTAASFDQLADTDSIQMTVTSSNTLIVRGLRGDISGNLYVYDLPTADAVSMCKGGEHTIDMMVVHVSEQWVIGVSMIDDRKQSLKANTPLLLWNISDGKVKFRIKGGKGCYTAVAFVGDAQQYLAVSRKIDPGITIYYTGTPSKPSYTATQLLKLGGHSKAAVSIISDSANKLLISASPDNTIKVWDLATALVLCDMAWDDLKAVESAKSKSEKKNQQHEKNGDDTSQVVYKGSLTRWLDRNVMMNCCATTIAISHHADYIATGCIFGQLLFIEVATYDFVNVKAHHKRSKRINALIFADDDEYVLSAGSSNRIMFWNHRNGDLLRTIDTKKMVRSVQLWQRRWLFVGHYYEESLDTTKSQSCLTVWDLDDKIGKNHSEIGATNCFHRFVLTNKSVLTWNGQQPRMFEIETGTELVMQNLTAEPKPNSNDEIDSIEQCWDMAIDRLGLHAVINVFRRLYVVDMRRRAVKYVIRLATRGNCLRISDRYPHYCFIGRYKNIDLLELTNGVIIKTFPIHNDFIDVMSLSNQDRIITTVSQDKTCRIIHCDWTQQQLHCLVTTIFHCPLRVGTSSHDNALILVGPESASPIAILAKNMSLEKVITDACKDGNDTMEEPTIVVGSTPLEPAVPFHRTSTPFPSIDEQTDDAEEPQPAEELDWSKRTEELLRLQFSVDSSNSGGLASGRSTPRGRPSRLASIDEQVAEDDGVVEHDDDPQTKAVLEKLRQNSLSTNLLLEKLGLGWRHHLGVDVYQNPSMDYDGERQLDVLLPKGGHPLLKMSQDSFDKCRHIASCYSGVATTRNIDTHANASVTCSIM